MSRSKENRLDQHVMQALKRIIAELGPDRLRQQQPERILDYIRRSPFLLSDLPDTDEDADKLIETSLERLRRHGYITQEIKYGEQQKVALWTITIAAEIPNINC